MKKKHYLLTIVTCFILSINCNAQNTTTKDESIDVLISKKREYNKNYDCSYKIQLYYGQETETRNEYNKFRVLFPDVSAKLNYDNPYWKVIVGCYKNILEADKALNEIRTIFSSSIIIDTDK